MNKGPQPPAPPRGVPGGPDPRGGTGGGGGEGATVTVGPRPPSPHCVFLAILTLEGETVVGVDAVIGYLHRCHEKLGETLAYVQYPAIAAETGYGAAEAQ